MLAPTRFGPLGPKRVGASIEIF